VFGLDFDPWSNDHDAGEVAAPSKIDDRSTGIVAALHLPTHLGEHRKVAQALSLMHGK
jgi:hypothetical protein